MTDDHGDYVDDRPIITPRRGTDTSILEERDLLYGIWRDVRFIRNVVAAVVFLWLFSAILAVAVFLIAAIGDSSRDEFTELNVAPAVGPSR